VMVIMEEILVANAIWLPLSPRRVMVEPSAETSQIIDRALPAHPAEHSSTPVDQDLSLL
jgi:hypothetical protein